MIKLICDICKKEVDRQDVCDEDGHATKDAMIDIEILDTYCRDYGGHYLICADCYNNIRDFINSRHTKWGFPKPEAAPLVWDHHHNGVVFKEENLQLGVETDN